MKIRRRNMESQKANHILCIILFAVFYLTSSFGNIFSNNITLVLLCLLGVVSLFCAENKFFISRKLVIMVGLVALNIVLTSILSEDGTKQMVLWGIYLFVTISIVSSFPMKQILNTYVKVMYFLCVSSLILWTAFLIAPSLVSRLPTVQNRSGYTAYTIFVASIYHAGNVGIARNQGIFWEPGAFQTFINLALMVSLFAPVESLKQRKYIVVFILTIITTFSTGGYIVLSAVIATYVVREMTVHKGAARKSMKLVLVCSLGVLLFFLMYENLPPNIRYQLFGKLDAFVDGENQANSSSTGVRVNSLIVSFQAFLQNPILGCGNAGMERISASFGSSIGTCTPINWFAYYGIGMGMIMNCGIYLFVKKMKGNQLIHLFLWITFLLSVSSENFWRNPSILMFVFMGYHGRLKCENIRN